MGRLSLLQKLTPNADDIKVAFALLTGELAVKDAQAIMRRPTTNVRSWAFTQLQLAWREGLIKINEPKA